MAGRMIVPAIAPMPKIEPIQYICADVAAAPLNAPMAVPVEADPKAEMNMSMPPIVAAPVILPVTICATRRARRARRPDTWVIAAMRPFRSRSICRNCFFVFTQLTFSIEGKQLKRSDRLKQRCYSSFEGRETADPAVLKPRGIGRCGVSADLRSCSSSVPAKSHQTAPASPITTFIQGAAKALLRARELPRKPPFGKRWPPWLMLWSASGAAKRRK